MQVPMGAMDLHHVEPGLIGPTRTGGEGVRDGRNLGRGQTVGYGVFGTERGSCRADGLPSAIGRQDEAMPLPRRCGRCLATGMGQLDAGKGALRVHEPDGTGQRFGLCVFPESHILGRDAPDGGDTGCLHDDETHAALRKASKMHEVPVGCTSITRFARVLAHWGNNDAVPEGHTADGHRLEQGRCIGHCVGGSHVIQSIRR